MNNPRTPWAWVPSLYMAEGIPYVAVSVLSVIMYKRLGLSNTDLAFYTSWLYLPWVIKPLWSPLVDAWGSKRGWILTLQGVFVVGLAGVGCSLGSEWWLPLTLVAFWALAFSSATHDIAADGLYILALDSHQQSLFVGVRSTFYRIATIATQGLLVWLVGWMEGGHSVQMAWASAFFLMACVFVMLTVWHAHALPRKEPSSGAAPSMRGVLGQFRQTIRVFLAKPHIARALLFMLLFRLPEALLTKMASPFLLDTQEAGGLGLSTGQVGWVYGTVGVICLTVGGLAGGWIVARCGLRRMMWWLVAAISLPDLVYVCLSLHPSTPLWGVCACVAIEQLGYGFGFTAYMLYLVYFAQGLHATSVYALCTAFMALGMMLPGLAAGWLADRLGYVLFFTLVVLLCGITAWVSVAVSKGIDEGFGKA